MKKYSLARNAGLKIAAFIFAVLLWILAVNIDNPVKSVVIRNVPITPRNEEVITNKGKTYNIVDEVQTVSVTVYAKRSVLSDIDISNISVTMDLSQMDVNTCLVPLTATVQGLSQQQLASITKVETNPKNMQVEIEDSIKSNFPIHVSTIGTPRDGYVVGELSTNPEKVTIGGPESVVNSIARVVAQVDVTGKSSDCTLDAQLLLYDGNGNQMDDSLLSNNLGEEGISVNVQMLRSKDVKLNFEMNDLSADGYICTGWTCEPERITVCGTKEVIAALSEITIPSSAVQLEGADSKQEETIDITPYLPEGVSLVDENANSVLLTITIEEIGVRTIELPVESIRINNLADDLKVSFEGTGILEVRFTGRGEELEKLDIRNAVSINLEKYVTEGTYEVKVDITEPALDVKLLEEPKIKVNLTKKEKEE